MCVVVVVVCLAWDLGLVWQAQGVTLPWCDVQAGVVVVVVVLE